MFQNVLVPIDFSDNATRALRLAVKVAREHKGRITLMHVGLAPGVLQPEAFGPGIPVALVQLHEQLATEHTHALEKLGRDEIPEDVLWRVLLKEGTPVDEILKESREGGYDLLVMGTHGRGGLDRLFLGSVTERVLRQADLPVLTTR
jgi:nucleotide-binding universal stress UspA family protein